ncbi:hypothetical protein [Rhodomicrobium lacus]|jgi:hypothetical protein|uniref:hypothetical protein n=1 Tax=Rhodomicrobium lacus TaxID=2498452 RepID=UPI000F8C30ED|nr:hypothetical protein [Rhodomicrobium lacus]WKW52098.1 hypothetical protein QMO75_06375 [Rhodomicrobium lacus]
MGWQGKLKEAALACCIALLLAQQPTRAEAFTAEPVAPPAAAQIPSSPLAKPAIPQSDFNAPSDQVQKSGGTEVAIPGIGVVGTLPKLDFGLELLYGPKNGGSASELSAPPLQFDQRSLEKDDVQIKGTFTHKF